jgi:hypothetical protein
VVAVEDLRRSHVIVRVDGVDIKITWATQRELLKLLQRAAGTLNVILHFENVGASRPVELDRDGNERVYRALTYWLEHPALGQPFPDDARALWAALANALKPGSPRVE